MNKRMSRLAQVWAVALGSVLGCASTAVGGVFDDAMAWWKFDQGGADGAVATKSEIHDARDASRNQPSGLYGANGGPLWSVMDVRLPHQRRTVRGTALHFPCDTRMNGTTPQAYDTSLAFTGLQHHGSELTVVARVRLEGQGVNNADAMLWNNAFSWGASSGSAVGFIRCVGGQRGAITTYVPYAFVGQNSFGNAPVDKTIPLKVGEWYDVAYLLSEETVDGTLYSVVTYVVADRGGVRTHTVRKAAKRTGTSTTYARMGCMNHYTDWGTYDATISKNTSDTFKNFDGWIHQLAVWNRKLSLDEVKEAFGRPVGHPEQDVYADASNWIRFDTDVNGDGKLQADEVRDLRHWNRPADGQPVMFYQNGPQGGPVWTNMTVTLPGRGVSVSSPCLYFPIATNVSENTSGQTICSAWPSSIKLANTLRAGSYTVMARIYPLEMPGAVLKTASFFYDNGIDWGSWSGSEFGLGTSNTDGNTFYPCFLLAHSTYTAPSLDMCTNQWYDIAFSVTDNGFDEDGNARTDTVIVAVQDIQHGFRYQVMNVGTNAYTSFASWTANGATVGGESAYAGFSDFYNLTTKATVNYGNPVKTYRGAIHEIVIWNRALTTNEIAAAFSHPNNMVMGVGTSDGANGEFAGTDGAYDCRVDTAGTAWRNIAGTLDAAHPELTFRFTPDANNVGLVHYLHVKAAEVGAADGQKAQISLSLNGRSVASAKDVGAYDDLWCVLSRSILKTGENVLKIAYAGGAAASFRLDSAEIVGSWQLGKVDDSNAEFVQEGATRSAPDFTLGNRRLKHVVRALTSGWKNNYLHFYVPAELAAKHAFTFESAMCDQSSSEGADNLFAIDLNDVEKFAAPADRKMARQEPIAFEIGRGELQPGWNTIHTRFTGKSGWMTFDFLRLRISDYNPATFLIIR